MKILILILTITILGGGCVTGELEPTEEYVKKEVEKRSGDLISTTEYLKETTTSTIDWDNWDGIIYHEDGTKTFTKE